MFRIDVLSLICSHNGMLHEYDLITLALAFTRMSVCIT